PFHSARIDRRLRPDGLIRGMDRNELIRQLMATFLEELEQLLGSMRVDLRALAQTSPPPDEHAQLELGKSLYRSVHSLKGAARSVDQELISSACQLLEELLPGPRNERGSQHVIDEPTS